MKRKIRKCPFCKSKKGFEITFWLGGIDKIQSDFNGNILNREREGTDKLDLFASCLNCKKLIEVEKLDIENL